MKNLLLVALLVCVFALPTCENPAAVATAQPGAILEPGAVPEPGAIPEPGAVPEPRTVPQPGAILEPGTVPEPETEVLTHGEFSYLLTFPPGAVADIALYSLPGMADMGLAPSHVCDDNGLTEWLELEAGAYLLTVHADMESRTAELAETVHITAGQYAEYIKDFVDGDFTPVEPPPIEPPPPTPRVVIIDMYDYYGDGWNGGGGLRVTVNGEEAAPLVRVSPVAGDNTPAGQRYFNTFNFTALPGDLVEFFWVAGTLQLDNSFIAYYENAAPLPAFSSDGKGAETWDGENALLYRVRFSFPNTPNGVSLGSFTVE